VSGVKGTLDNGDTVRLDELQLVTELAQEFEPKEGAVEEVEKSHKVERIVKHREGLDSENILTCRLRRH
jgi:hypothetical protein